MAKLTPMMEQYFEIKNKYKDCIIDKITLEELMVLIIKGEKKC